MWVIMATYSEVGIAAGAMAMEPEFHLLSRLFLSPSRSASLG
jgi:hypothetical protein